MNGAAWWLRGLWLLAAALPAAAQTVVARSAATSVACGEPFDLVVDATWPESLSPPLALEPRQLAPFVVESIVDETNGPGVRRQRLRLRGYVAGELALGPLVLQFPGAGGVRTARSERLPVAVRSGLPEPAGDYEWPGDVRDLPRGALPWWWGAPVLGLGLGVWWWRRRRPSPIRAVLAAPPASSAADLPARLRALPLPRDAAATVAFHAAVKALLREHLQARWQVDTQVATSEELLRRAAAPALAECLAACDHVLFAASRPGSAAAAHTRDLAAEFVTTGVGG